MKWIRPIWKLQLYWYLYVSIVQLSYTYSIWLIYRPREIAYRPSIKCGVGILFYEVDISMDYTESKGYIYIIFILSLNYKISIWCKQLLVMFTTILIHVYLITWTPPPPKVLESGCIWQIISEALMYFCKLLLWKLNWQWSIHIYFT